MFTPSRGSLGETGFEALARACALIGLFVCQLAVGDDMTPARGRAATAAELAGVSTHIYANGDGLPKGGGDGIKGEEIYARLCADCHGDAGQGGSAMELVGDRALLATEYPDRGIAVYWPYAPSLFEYIKRSMPPDKPYSLSSDELYSVIARLLELNSLIEPGQRVDAGLLSALQMPNRDGFRPGYNAPD